MPWEAALTGLLDVEGSLDEPASGSTVSLLCSTRDVVALAELDSWSASASGLVVTSGMTTTPELAQLLDGERVWASTYTQRTNTLVVFEGLASQSRRDQPAMLTVTGVSVIAREHRRSEPRAHVPCEIDLRIDEARPVAARTVDLSRSGCRVELGEPHSLAVGDTAVAELTLGAAAVVRTSCEVLRLDERGRQAVLGFRDLTDADAAAISRSVFASLTPSASATPRPA